MRQHHAIICVYVTSVMTQSINQYILNVLGGNWDPTDKKFSSVNSYRQDLLPICKAFPKETTTRIWFTQSHKVCNKTNSAAGGPIGNARFANAVT